MTIGKDIKDEEMKAIEELRHRLKGDMETEMFEDDHFFRRFLAARDFNIDNAEDMLRKHLECRKKYDIKNILNYKQPEVVEKYFPYSFLGNDKEGCVIRYCPIGNTDFGGLFASIKLGDVANALIYETEWDIENLKQQSKKLGRNVDEVVYIADLSNLSFALVTDKRAINYLIFLMKLYINNYPERLKAGYALNASFYFSIVHALMKTVLPASIMEKIHVYSDDSYKQDLLKVIDADTLPAFLGGNKTDPDGNPLCETFVKHGSEKVPESYYIHKKNQPLSKEPGVKKVTLSRAAFHEVNLEVKEPGSYLEWEFETKCRDIGFGVFYNEIVGGEEKITELVPMQRIDTEAYPETGAYRCESAGTYVILFDNTYSWVRAKEIYYKTKIATPEEKEAESKDNGT